jgi:hypothetical protein
VKPLALLINFAELLIVAQLLRLAGSSHQSVIQSQSAGARSEERELISNDSASISCDLWRDGV